MIGFANAKINLGLRVVGKRKDGFHLLETVFYPVPWQDSIEILPAEQNSISIVGHTIPGPMDQNLCSKAYQLLAKDYSMTNVAMYLHKHIPIGAGLGGGSSDAVQVLKLLDQLFHIGLNQEQMHQYALQLGADCPFFVENVPCLATGIGDILTPINRSLKGYWIVILKPSVFVSTAEAFAHIQPKPSESDLHDSIQRPVEEWEGTLLNDFEDSIFKRYPVIASAKALLVEKGALFASMSGTGASVFGLFTNKPDFATWGWNEAHYVGLLE
jgi:4-diphosphocytidyl-2-C-methyl-D-erythritol kinase